VKRIIQRALHIFSWYTWLAIIAGLSSVCIPVTNQTLAQREEDFHRFFIERGEELMKQCVLLLSGWLLHACCVLHRGAHSRLIQPLRFTTLFGF